MDFFARARRGGGASDNNSSNNAQDVDMEQQRVRGWEGERTGEIAGGGQTTTESSQSQPSPRRTRLGLPQLSIVFGSNTGTSSSSSSSQRHINTNTSTPAGGDSASSPKTPRSILGLPPQMSSASPSSASAASPRLGVPSPLTRTQSDPAEASSSTPTASSQQHQLSPMGPQQRPPAAHRRLSQVRSSVFSSSSGTSNTGIGGILGGGGRRGGGHRHVHSAGSRRTFRSMRREEEGRGKRFMFCLPWISSRRIRMQMAKCLVSGMVLIFLLSIYLALSITRNINTGEFTVLLILVILFTTIFFCHGLIRLCMILVKPPSSDEERDAAGQGSRPPMLGPGYVGHLGQGYAVPRRPIRVVLARDEEAAGIESETAKLQPPAYGLWRESVRVDPNRIYWQRAEQANNNNGRRGSRVPAAAAENPRQQNDDDGDGDEAGRPRPPSYASEDGVDYVVEARPRSTAPVMVLEGCGGSGSGSGSGANGSEAQGQGQGQAQGQGQGVEVVPVPTQAPAGLMPRGA